MKFLKYVLLIFILYFFMQFPVDALSGQPLKDGVYTIRSSIRTNSVLDVNGGKMSNRTNIQIYNSNSTLAQKWKLTYLGNGYYKIASMKNNAYVLDVKGAGKKKGTNVQLYSNNNSKAQQWMIKDAGGGYYYIVSRCNGLYMDIKGGKVANKTNIQMYTKNNTKAQKFIFSPIISGKQTIEDGEYILSTKLNTNRVIDLYGGNIKNQNKIQLHDYNGTETEHWIITYLNNGYYKIASSKNPNYVLDLRGGGLLKNTVIQLYKYTGSVNQQFAIREVEKGYYTLLSRTNGLAFDVKGGNSASGTIIQTYIDNDTNAQRFQLKKVTISPTKVIPTGDYVIASTLSMQYLFDVDPNAIRDKNISLNTTFGSKRQKWHIESLEDGYYKISSLLDDNLVLSSINGKLKLTVEDENSSSKWIIRKINSDYYFIDENGNYISIDGNSINTKPLVLNPIRIDQRQKFRIVKTTIEEGNQILEDGFYTISSLLNTSKNIDLTGGKTTNNTNIQLYSMASTSNQKWHIQYVKEGFYKISSIKNNNKVFDIQGYGDTDHTNVQLYDYTGNFNQQFIIKEDENGYYSFLSNCGGMYINVSNGSINNGTNIDIAKSDNSLSQKFLLTEVKDTYFGTDASSHQGKMNWTSIKKSNIDFAIIRIGYGADYSSQDDKQFLYNAQECAKNKIPYGTYIYSYAENEQEIKGEVNHTMRLIQSLPTNTKAYMKLPIFIDMEEDSYAKYGKTHLTNLADKYCIAINQKGYACGVYANKNWLTNNLNASYLEKKYMIWLAHYTGVNTFSKALSKKSDYKGSYNIWQFTNKGTLAGINSSANLDMGYNLF